MRRKFSLLLMLSVLVVFATTAQADLNRVGPTNLPSPPQNGFPAWYQDLSGLVLDLCLPTPETDTAQQAACLLVPGPGIPTPPYVFASNYPSEIFYHRAVSNINTSPTKRAVLVLALEAAFASGNAAAGQQIVFTRIRVTAGVPFNGTYTVTHPYGVEVFPDVVAGAGNRDINFSEDVGIGAPGVFTGALTSRVGPFLQNPAGPVNVGNAQFLGDGVTLTPVTGSPFGTNWFEICGPFDGPPPALERCIRETNFTLTGRLHNLAANPISSPLTITQSTYTRDAAGTQAHVDVGANAIPGIGQAAAKLTAAAPTVPPVLMRGPNTPALGDYYAQGIPVPAGAVPASITVTNSGDVPPTSATVGVMDEVKITQATWDGVNNSLTVIATSSDKFADVVPPATVGATPALRIDGFPTATQSPGGIAGDPASVTFTVLNVPIPPSSLTVSSSKGGQGFSTVSMGVVSPAFPCGVPFTQDDQATTTQSVAVVIQVLANDSTAAACPLTGLPVILAGSGPTLGTAVVNGDGTITFTSATTGTDTFKYTVANGVGTSNVATVTVNVIPGAAGPIPTATPDSAAVSVGSSVVINVLANDSGNGGTLDPTTVTIGTLPTRGTATPNPTTGAITYTPSGTLAGTDTFTYTVRNTNLNLSNAALVTVTITGPETLVVTRSEYVQNSRRWRVIGTSNVLAGQTITITYANGTMRNAQLVNGVSTTSAVGYIVGTAVVDALGTWTLDFILPSALGIANPTNTGNNTPTGSFWTSPPRNVKVTSSLAGANTTANLTIK